MTIATRPRRQRKWTLDISRDELRLKLSRRIGKRAYYRPKPGTEKSTNICIWDIALLARAHCRSVRNFLQCKPCVPGYATAGQETLRRVNEILDLVNGGYILKSQYGVYHFFDTPQVAPVRNMRVNLLTGMIGKEIYSPPVKQKMPSFTTVFGSK